MARSLTNQSMQLRKYTYCDSSSSPIHASTGLADPQAKLPIGADVPLIESVPTYPTRDHIRALDCHSVDSKEDGTTARRAWPTHAANVRRASLDFAVST